MMLCINEVLHPVIKTKHRTSRLWQAPPCSSCGVALSGATSFEGATPSPGDLTLCLYCGALLVFTEPLGVIAPPLGWLALRAATPAEEADLDAETKQDLARKRRAMALLPERVAPSPEEKA